MSFLWNLLRIFRICKGFRPRSLRFTATSGPQALADTKTSKEKTGKTLGAGYRLWVIGFGLISLGF